MTVTLLSAGSSVGSVSFTLEQLTSAIRGLGRARKHMTCDQPRPPIEGQHVPAVSDISWYVGPELSLGGAALVFDHPCFGPLAFIIPPDQVAQTTRALTLQSQMASLASTVPN